MEADVFIYRTYRAELWKAYMHYSLARIHKAPRLPEAVSNQ